MEVSHSSSPLFHDLKSHQPEIYNIGENYYWIGENKLNGTNFQSINCYVSQVSAVVLVLFHAMYCYLVYLQDFTEWTYQSTLLSLQHLGDLGPNRVVERPHVLYNKRTRKFVMWIHIDSANYTEARTGVATSDTICGSYEYQLVLANLLA